MAVALPYPDPFPEGRRARLRPWRDSDLPQLLAGDSDALVHRYRYSLPADADQGRIWLAESETARRRGERLELAVCLAGCDLVVGSVSLWGIHPGHRSAMLSWWLGEVARGRGVASEAVMLLARWAYDQLELSRLGAEVETTNRASQRVAERCGFTREGTLRARLQTRDGSRVDCVVYGLLAADLRDPGAGHDDRPGVTRTPGRQTTS